MNSSFRSAGLFIIAFILPILSWAKKSKAAIDITLNKGELWYYFPWIWVIGGAIFILSLVAMIRSHQKKYH